MNNKLYESLMSNISYTISGILNENNIDTEERQMYEQDKLDNETWKQMADRVGFTDWYQQMGLQSKNIGDTYAKRRQRWLANNCKNENVIKNEIENLEDCIEFAYLGDDNYINVPDKNDRNNKISELEQEIKDLKNRLLILSNKIDNSDTFNTGCLDVNKMDPDMLTNPETLDFSGYSNSFIMNSVSMLNNLKSCLKDFKEEYK